MVLVVGQPVGAGNMDPVQAAFNTDAAFVGMEDVLLPEGRFDLRLGVFKPVVGGGPVA